MKLDRGEVASRWGGSLSLHVSQGLTVLADDVARLSEIGDPEACAERMALDLRPGRDADPAALEIFASDWPALVAEAPGIAAGLAADAVIVDSCGGSG